MIREEARPKFTTQFRYEIPVEYDASMKVPAVVYGDQGSVDSAWKDGSINQLVNVATLPSIVKAAYAMPDVHGGYGFPIGGVAAFDYDSGIVSPGGVGYDINCGVSLYTIPVDAREFMVKRKAVVDGIFKKVPSGLGNSASESISMTDLGRILDEGLEWAVGKGMALDGDLERTEERGHLPQADASRVSGSARQRGKNQVGTLGAGNHFLEVQRVREIHDRQIAGSFGIGQEDQIVVMIHTGSRGLGHQIATDYLKEISSSPRDENLKDEQLMHTPIHDRVGSRYIAAMAAGANFGFVNRAVIGWRVRETFRETFGIPADEVKLVYSLAHNIAKIEDHMVDGHRRKLMVHRKGATRALPRGLAENPFRETGHPVLVPGDMGTGSCLLVGEPASMDLSFGSSCHGAGRLLSRHASLRKFTEHEVMSGLERAGVYTRFSSKKVLLEEAPGSYKDLERVVEITVRSGLAKKVASFSPLGVVKG